jgi:cyclopropane fatty-acyl-phospholipid synthase-like methyltransferase
MHTIYLGESNRNRESAESAAISTKAIMNSSQDAPNDDDAIKTMKLYTHVERIQREVEFRFGSASTIDPIALSEIDCMHYEGNDAIEDVIRAIKLNSSSKVLDVGSGFGGVARVLSAQSKCTTIAMELQPDIHHCGEDLTKRCNISDLVKHVHGDILNYDLNKLGDGPSTFDGLVSFLVFLHIPDKLSLLNNCAKMLKTGGAIFVEDYYRRSSFTAAELKSLSTDVFCQDLPTQEEYISALETAGFDNIQFIDKTKEWTAFVTDRLATFEENKETFISSHGEPTYTSLHYFYKSVVTLFAGGNLGGVRIIASKKS